MLKIENLSIALNKRVLIKNLSLILKKGDKLAIIGEEGNGKSTLLKTIAGLCDYGERTGSIEYSKYKIGYLPQTIENQDLNQKVFEFLFSNQEDYYFKMNHLYKYLDVMEIKEEILKEKLDTLSGGEKIKIGLLKILLEEADILLLDEPSNDLDLESLKWLEKFINTTTKPILYVSHDETLLANTANRILHLEQIKKKTECKHTLANVGYETYVTERLQALEKQTQRAKFDHRVLDYQLEKYQKIRQKVEYQQKTISRKDPHGAAVLKKKMHSLKVQEKKLNPTNLTEIPDVEESIHFFFEIEALPKTKKILSLNLPILKVKGKILAYNIKLEIYGNPHICIIGKNGVGKSTLLKKIYEEVKKKKELKVGYMPQFYQDVLEENDLVLNFLTKNTNQTEARAYLGNMKFTRDEMEARIKEISNGSKAKLLLVKMILEKCNVLVLDEPTRNVSPLSNPVIRNALKEFKGTIISVSHDRKYIEEVMDTVYILKPEGLTKKEENF